MLPFFLIGLREGLEASLVVGILVAYLVRTGRREHLWTIWAGVGAAAILSLAFGATLTFTSAQMTFQAQEAFGGILSIVAVGFVTWMIFWMRRAARSMRTELNNRMDRAVSMGTGALVATAFIAVGREGLETALFVWSAVSASSNGAWPFLGLSLGLAAAVALGWLLYTRAVSLDLRRFFLWTGVGLIIVAGGVLAYGIHDLQEAGILPGLNSYAFDVSHVIAPTSVIGTLLKGVFNFSPATTWLQAIAWVLYVVPCLVIFLRPSRPVAKEAPPTGPPDTSGEASSPAVHTASDSPGASVQ